MFIAAQNLQSGFTSDEVLKMAVAAWRDVEEMLMRDGVDPNTFNRDQVEYGIIAGMERMAERLRVPPPWEKKARGLT